MAIKTHDVVPSDPIGHRSRTFPVQSVTANGTVVIALFAPAHRYQIQAVRVFAGTGTANIASVDVQIGGVSVLSTPAVPIAGAEVNAAMASSVALRRGAKGSACQVRVTAQSSPVLVNMWVEVLFRPFPMNGEAAVGS